MIELPEPFKNAVDLYRTAVAPLGFTMQPISHEPGSGAYEAVLSNGRVRIMVTHYRSDDHAFMSGNSTSEWFEVPLLMELLSGEVCDTYNVAQDHVDFVVRHLDEISQRLDIEQVSRTRQEIEKLQEKRARRYWGEIP